jgi:hypothetical protein
VFVFDDGLDFETRAVEIAKVNVVSRAAADLALQLAAAALAGRDDPRAEALRRNSKTRMALLSPRTVCGNAPARRSFGTTRAR